MKKQPTRSTSKIVQKEIDPPLPQPMELAKLAAMLMPNAQPAEALEKAMQFYTEAVCFTRELPSTLEDLVARFGSDQRSRALDDARIQPELDTIWNDRLELDPNKDDDDVRQFFAKNGFDLKTHGSVLDNIRKCQDARPVGFWDHATADEVIEDCERVKDGKKFYLIPRRLLQRVVNWKKARRSDSRRKGARTKAQTPVK